MKSYEVHVENSQDLENLIGKMQDGYGFSKISIVGNSFKSSQIIEFANLLATNSSTEEMFLEFGADSDKHIWHFMASLQANNFLSKLKISCPKMSDQVLLGVADFLRVNRSLKSLYLSFEKESESGIMSIAESLKSNTCLKNLQFSTYPFLSNKCLEKFAEAMQQNHSITKIGLPSMNYKSLDLINTTCERNKVIGKSLL